MPDADLTASCPMSKSDVVDTYFMEHRAKLIDIAAFFDRVGRAQSDAGDTDAGETGANDTGATDFRLKALQVAIHVLADGKEERAQRILEVFSDPTIEALASAQGMKGAAGAWPGGIPGQDGNPELPSS